MPKRKTMNSTSELRYLAKMYKYIAGKVPDELANKISERAMVEWRSKYDEYRAAYEAVKPVLIRAGIKRALFGIYRSAALEYMNKVAKQRLSEAVWMQKWVDQGCDAIVLRHIANVLAIILLEKAGGGKLTHHITPGGGAQQTLSTQQQDKNKR